MGGEPAAIHAAVPANPVRLSAAGWGLNFCCPCCPYLSGPVPCAAHHPYPTYTGGYHYGKHKYKGKKYKHKRFKGFKWK